MPGPFYPRWLGSPHGREIPGPALPGAVIGANASIQSDEPPGPVNPVFKFQAPPAGYNIDAQSFVRLVQVPVSGYSFFSVTLIGLARLLSVADGITNAGYFPVPIRFKIISTQNGRPKTISMGLLTQLYCTEKFLWQDACDFLAIDAGLTATPSSAQTTTAAAMSLSIEAIP